MSHVSGAELQTSRPISRLGPPRGATLRGLQRFLPTNFQEVHYTRFSRGALIVVVVNGPTLAFCIVAYIVPTVATQWMILCVFLRGKSSC